MGQIKTKKRFRTLVFYICILILLALIWIHRVSIWVGAISLLNFLAETLDSLAGN